MARGKKRIITEGESSNSDSLLPTESPENMDESSEGSDHEEETQNINPIQEEEEIPKPANKKRRKSTLTSVSINQINIKQLKVVDFAEVQRLKREWETLLPEQRTTPISHYIPKDLRGFITAAFASVEPQVKCENDWIGWPADEILTKLLEWCPHGMNDQTPGQTAEERMLAANFSFNGTSITPLSSYSAIFYREYSLWERDISSYSDEEKKKRIHKLIGNILKKLKDKVPEKSAKAYLISLLEKTKYDSGQEFINEIVRNSKEIITIINKAKSCGMLMQKENDTKRSFPTTSSNYEYKNTKTIPQTSEPKPIVCNGCGRTGHEHSKCGLKNHPDFNKNPNVPWHKSAKGQEWRKKVDKFNNPYETLPFDHALDGSPFKDYDPSLKRRSKKNKLLGISIIKYKLPMFISFQAFLSESHKLNGYAYIDTGAMSGNYIASDILKDIFDLKLKKSNITTVDNKTINFFGSIKIKEMSLIKENKNVKLINEKFRIIESDIEVIIGLPTIKKYNLVTREFPELFEEEGSFIVDCTVSKRKSSCQTIMDSSPEKECEDIMETEWAQSDSCNTSDLTISNTRKDSLDHGIGYSRNTVLLIKSKEELLGIPENKDKSEYPDENVIYFEDFLKRRDDEDFEIINKIKFVSDDVNFIKELKDLCLEYIDIFKVTLNKDPADILEMEINVDDTLWEQSSNREACRKQGPVREQIIRKLINEMIDANIICTSHATAWSQILLVPKPNGEYRMCIDYRQLNNATKTIKSWPLPNIKEILDRLGTKKAKYYSKMDLTKGYFQAPLAKASRKYTAFTAAGGYYEFLRVPMGAKGSPAYFQYAISFYVLAGLLYVISELYIDDILVHAQTKQEMLKNLKLIFKRLKERRVTLNPDKCIFGCEEIEFVGHTINSEGIKMSDEKKNKILNFNKPKHMKGLKSFIGLANYFRDHIKNHSLIVEPLQRMLSNYRKNKLLKWTEKADIAFKQIKEAISNAPLLYFVNDNAMILVNTDASDYAIGGYLYQIIENKEKPIAFMSHSLNSCQKRWSTYDKEAYAIYMSLKTWEHLLIGRKFLLLTDHKNLTYVRNSPSLRVNRWLTEIQHLDFDVEHVIGEKNLVADSFSRLIDVESEDHNENNDNNNESLMLIKDKIHIPSKIHGMISKCHNSFVGHHGFDRTIKKLKRKGIIIDDSLKDWVKLFIQKCPTCQKTSQINPIINATPFINNTSEAFLRVNVDTIGPLPTTKLGNKHILVIVDCFTRWTEIYAMKSTEAKEAAQCFLEFFSRFGCPKELLSDNGTQFVNELIREFLLLVNSNHLLTTPYSKEENGLVERANKEVLRHLQNMVYDDKLRDEWDIALPLVRRILNATDHSAIGTSPAQLVYAGAIDLDRNIIKEFNKIKKKNKISDYLSKMMSLQKAIVNKAIETQLITNNNHFKNKKIHGTEFSLGEYVLIRYPMSRMGRKAPTKLHTPWQGPMKIISKIDSIYTVLNLITGKLTDVHISRMKLFVQDVDKSPEEVAAEDDEMFIVDEIIEHHPPKLTKNNIHIAKFFVSWIGYESSDNTWQSFESLERNEVLHDYLRKNNLSHLIPDRFK